jgi:hypothetical protein
LGPGEHAAAELEEFGDQVGGVVAGDVGGVDFGGEQDGSGYVGTAFETIFFFMSGKLD